MEIKLTANAGVLIKTDGVRILLDGVCRETEYYLGTPCELKGELTLDFPDVVGFTHLHSDHFDGDYANLYKSKTLRPILGSECSALRVGNVTLTAIPTRHIGKSKDEHFSFIIEGSRRIFFMGDASPIELKKFSGYGVPDVLVVPFAYLNTESALRLTKSSGASEIVLVHMPDRKRDPYNLWEAVETTTKHEKIRFFTEIGDTIILQ